MCSICGNLSVALPLLLDIRGHSLHEVVATITSTYTGLGCSVLSALQFPRWASVPLSHQDQKVLLVKCSSFVTSGCLEQEVYVLPTSTPHVLQSNESQVTFEYLLTQRYDTNPLAQEKANEDNCFCVSF